MINKLKISLLIAVLSLAVGIGSAHAANLTFSSDTTVTVGASDYTIKAGSEATSVIVGATTVTVVVPVSSTFVFTSPDNWKLNNDAGLTPVCGSLENTLTIVGTGATVVITPDATNQCAGTGGGHHGGGGGGGSSSSSSSTTTTDTGCAAGNLFSTTTGKACSSTSASVGCGAGNAFSPITGASCGTTVTNTTVIVSPPVGNFGYAFGTAVVKLGTRGEACRAWQTFFNNLAGAHLVLDGWCGNMSIAAAKAWQASQGLVADGLLGPMSRAKANMQASMHTQMQ